MLHLNNPIINRQAYLSLATDLEVPALFVLENPSCVYRMNIPSHGLLINIWNISRNELWLTHLCTSLKSLPSALSAELDEWSETLGHFCEP